MMLMAGLLTDGRLAYLLRVALIAAAFVAEGSAMAVAMGGGEVVDLRAACNLSTRAKADAAAGDICELFRDRLAQAYPERNVVEAATGADADVRLVVDVASAVRIEVRLIWEHHGAVVNESPFGMARADRSLDTAAVSAFFDRVIAAVPSPE